MQSTSNAPGKGFLKITGILLVVFGILSALALIAVLILGIINSGTISDAISQFVNSVSTSGLTVDTPLLQTALIVVMYALGCIALIGSAFYIVMGIFGIKNCDKPEKAGVCMVLAVIGCVLVGGGLLVVLYLIGAAKNKYSVAPPVPVGQNS
ncbi:MAG: hypothetical protein FWC62_06465 [Firmicutes bacterium]|nr:hypothetical protein [Bacillota bacterium]